MYNRVMKTLNTYEEQIEIVIPTRVTYSEVRRALEILGAPITRATMHVRQQSGTGIKFTHDLGGKAKGIELTVAIEWMLKHCFMRQIARTENDVTTALSKAIKEKQIK